MKTIALTMIARNEERCIARCLDSVAPWVDEMIVLDTGSTDRTQQIARQHGATVHQTTWPNDFSVARNAVLNLSHADWNLVLDADEWILSGGEFLKKLRTLDSLMSYTIRVESLLGDRTTQLKTAHDLARVLPAGVRYQGRVHEQPVHNLPSRKSGLLVMHDGYLAEQREKKTGRNLSLLQQTIQQYPKVGYYHYQLAKAHEIMGNIGSALKAYLKAYRLEPERTDWHHDLVIRSLHCMLRLGKTQEAMIFASNEMAYWEKSPDFHLILGSVLLEQMQRHPDQGRDIFPMLEACWTKAIELGDQPDLPGSIAGQGTFIAAQKLSALYRAMKDHEKAEHYQAIYENLHLQFKSSLEQCQLPM